MDNPETMSMLDTQDTGRTQKTLGVVYHLVYYIAYVLCNSDSLSPVNDYFALLSFSLK